MFIACRNHNPNRIRALFLSNFLSEARAISSASSMSRGISVSRRCFHRWGFATVIVGCPLQRMPRRTYLPTYNGNHVNYRKWSCARARARAGVSSPRSGNGVCHYYGDRLTVNARYSFPPYARAGAPFPP